MNVAHVFSNSQGFPFVVQIPQKQNHGFHKKGDLDRPFTAESGVFWGVSPERIQLHMWKFRLIQMYKRSTEMEGGRLSDHVT